MPAPRFTARELGKIQQVFTAYRIALKKRRDARRAYSPYDNALGCGNCGDLWNAALPLELIEQALGLKDPQSGMPVLNLETETFKITGE